MLMEAQSFFYSEMEATYSQRGKEGMFIVRKKIMPVNILI